VHDRPGYNKAMTTASTDSPVRGWRLSESCDDVDWARAKTDLAADGFDNGRSPAALRRSFENSQYVVFAWVGDRVVGMARLLSDGVCNAYLLDVWTHSVHRRCGIGAAMVRHLITLVPGQHVGWQTDDAIEFYDALGARRQPEFMSIVSGSWLGNDANRS
jgi:ribosomal protein S18 acetylase RimI-like enzyme